MATIRASMDRIRDAVIIAYQGRCHYCDNLFAHTVDHVIATARGGAHAPDNFVLACHSCNSSKRDKVLPPHQLRATLEVARRCAKHVTQLLQEPFGGWVSVRRWGEKSCFTGWSEHSHGEWKSVRRIGRWESDLGRMDVHEHTAILNDRQAAISWLWGMAA